MTTQQSISIETLSEKLGGNLWIKGDLKRIYLDEGYNTKKMSTKTFVWQDENGEFKVSCKVDCPSQPWQWCKSQEDEIKGNVLEKIKTAIRLIGAELVEFKMLVERPGDVMVRIKDEARYGHSEGVWMDEEAFYQYYNDYPSAVFGIIAEALKPVLDRLRRDREVKLKAEESDKIEAKNQETKILKETGAIPADAARVRHGRFGLGTVVKSDATIIEILFDNSEFGLKKLLTKFANLETVSND